MSTWSMPAGSGDRWPDDYERGRPGWPRDVLAVPELPAGAAVLDLGAGTGKLTRLLVSAFARVVAVEPAEAMRRRLVELCPRAEALAGTGSQIPLPDASVDAVFAAQSFHWFDDEPALAEIARVLRPGGSLVLLWNLPAGRTTPAIDAVEELLRERMPAGELGYDPLDLGGPRSVPDEWPHVFGAAGFGPIRAARLPNPQMLDREGVVAFYASMGWIGDLPDADRLPLLDAVRSRLTAGEYRRPWETYVYSTRLAAAHDAPPPAT